MKPTPLKKGFTLIEIVIVLAIAALIMVIVFIAVQGAQRARRDTQRKNDVNRVAALLESYASSNSGTYPDTSTKWTTFYTNFVSPSTDFKDPSTGTPYTANSALGTNTACSSTAAPRSGSPAVVDYSSGTGRSYILHMCLEQGDYSRDSNNP